LPFSSSPLYISPPPSTLILSSPLTTGACTVSLAGTVSGASHHSTTALSRRRTHSLKAQEHPRCTGFPFQYFFQSNRLTTHIYHACGVITCICAGLCCSRNRQCCPFEQGRALVDCYLEENQQDQATIEQRPSTYKMSHRDPVITERHLVFVLNHGVKGSRNGVEEGLKSSR